MKSTGGPTLQHISDISVDPEATHYKLQWDIFSTAQNKVGEIANSGASPLGNGFRI